jgi:hypothetical protein
LFLEVVAIPHRNSLAMELILAIFVAIGLYIVVGRYYADAYVRERTFYGVSDRRAVIVTEIRQRRIRAYTIERLMEIDLVAGTNGRGTLVFGRHDPRIQRNPPILGLRRQGDAKPAFAVIDSLDEVLRALREAQGPRQQKS